MLEAAERGIYSDLQWLYRFIEKRDATIRALVMRRRSALEKLDWNIKVKPEEENAKAKAQQEALRDAYDMIDNLREAIDFLALAEFRGFSHVEKHFNADGDVFHLEPVEQWYWARRMPRRRWLYNKRAQSTDNGFEIDNRNFIIREVSYPINEVAVICYMRKSLSHKDWDAFVETYGLPPLFIEMPESAPIGLQVEYQQLAEKIIADMRGVLPFGAKIHTVAPDNYGTFSPFKEHIDYQDSQIVMAGTGGKLTMLNDPTGLGSGQSEVHAATFDEIAKAEAKQINECFQKQLDHFILNQLFPGEEHLAYFELEAEDDIDVNQLVQNVVSLNSAGYREDVEELAEKTGLKLTEQQMPGMMGEGEGGSVGGSPSPAEEEDKFVFRDAHVEANAANLVAEAIDRDMAYIRSRLDQIMLIEDDNLRNRKLHELQSKIPAMLKDINRDPTAAEHIANAMSTAFFQGASNE